MRLPEGINIELTPCQFDYLYEVIMFAYEMDVPEDVTTKTCGVKMVQENYVLGVLYSA